MTAAALALQRRAIDAQRAGISLRGTDGAGFYRPALELPQKPQPKEKEAQR
jgi:hypothetical protein